MTDHQTILIVFDHQTIPVWDFFFFLQVGCGAIGCELLKNFALLGIAGSPSGKVHSVFLLVQWFVV